jgi:hypothetical protein
MSLESSLGTETFQRASISNMRLINAIIKRQLRIPSRLICDACESEPRAEILSRQSRLQCAPPCKAVAIAGV